MSFHPSDAQKQATTNLGQVGSAAQDLSRKETAAGEGLLNVGDPNVRSGTNFFQTLLNGNRAASTALLQPQIDQVRQGSQNQIQAISTLTPRGGGRSGTLFNASYAPQAQIQNLFNPLRSQAANALPQIGLQQQGLGANLFQIGNQPLNTSVGANTNIAQIEQQQQQMKNQFWSSLGAGAFGLATMPFGGGTAANGLLGMIPGFGKKN